MSINYIQQHLSESVQVLQLLQESSTLTPTIDTAAAMMTQALRAGNKILFCGNGGSAADSQHLAAEFSGRFLRDRQPLAAMALTVDSSALTAIGNDYGYEQIFSRQVTGIGRSGDVLVAISTSGESANVVEAAKAARHKGIHVIALTGANGGALAAEADLRINIPAERTDLIQQAHITVGHILCGLVEKTISE